MGQSLDYGTMPVSVTEARAERDMLFGGKIWTPRDTLIHMLRMIDSGEVSPDSLVVIYRLKKEDGSTLVSYARAAPDHETALGICAEGMGIMMRMSNGAG